MEGYTMQGNHAAVAVDSKPNGATVVQGQVAPATPAATPVSQVPVQPTYEQLKAQLAALQALQATNGRPGALTLKVSAKGAVSVYGLGKWPLTLYQGTFIRVLDAADQIRAFIAAHESELSVKASK